MTCNICCAFPCMCPSEDDFKEIERRKRPYVAGLNRNNTARENNIPDHITTIIRGKMNKPLSMQLNNLAMSLAQEIHSEKSPYSETNSIEGLGSLIEKRLVAFMLTYQENLLKNNNS